jgi:flagellar FliJ protein
MEAYKYKFAKILSLREREKEEVQTSFQESKRKFEEVAQELYQVLKKKEDLEKFQAEKLISGFAASEIRHYQQFISNLDQMILYWQDEVMKSRNRMSWFEEKLVEKNIEVKKYEKIREKDHQKFTEEYGREESKRLDELSVIQYMNRGTR